MENQKNIGAEKPTPKLNKAFAVAVVVFAAIAVGVTVYAQSRALTLPEYESIHGKLSASISEAREQLQAMEQELACLESEIAAAKIQEELKKEAPSPEEIQRLSAKLGCLGK